MVELPEEELEVLLNEERAGKERFEDELVLVRVVLVLFLSFFGGSWISFFTHERILSLSRLDRIYNTSPIHFLAMDT